MHVDTGPTSRGLDYRDRRVAEGWHPALSRRCRRRSTLGVWSRRPALGPRGTVSRRSRSSTRSPSTVSTRCSAVDGATRRRPAVKERVYSFRDDFGQWDPKNQRPGSRNLYNGRHRKGEHIRVFPLSNWTVDIWQYVADDGIACRRSTTRTAVRCSSAMACCSRSRRTSRSWTARSPRIVWSGSEPSATRLHRRGGVKRYDGRAGHRRGRRVPGDRPRRHDVCRRPHLGGRDGGPQARGILLMPVSSRVSGGWTEMLDPPPRGRSTTARAR